MSLLNEHLSKSIFAKKLQKKKKLCDEYLQPLFIQCIILVDLAISRFNPDNKIHKRRAELSEEAHSLVQRGKSIEDIQKEINLLVFSIRQVLSTIRYNF